MYVGTCRFRAPAAPAWRLRSSFDSCSKPASHCRIWAGQRCAPACLTRYTTRRRRARQRHASRSNQPTMASTTATGTKAATARMTKATLDANT